MPRGENQPIHSISEVLDQVNEALSEKILPLWVTGEITNFSKSQRGHCYFALVEANAKLNCVMWQSTARRIPFDVENGSKVNVRIEFDLYKPSGNLSAIVSQIELAGEGVLRQQYERLKARLDAEGLFDQKHKKTLPKYPSRIAVVTAEGGAAFSDVRKNVNERFPLVQLLHIPSLVQGPQAPADIVKAIEFAARPELRADVVLITRGGGSFEDLNGFNDERVARAIFNCPTPTVSAIGHEIDVTIADFVADHRAPTPSSAAVQLTPSAEDLIRRLGNVDVKIGKHVDDTITKLRLGFNAVANRLQNPDQLLEIKQGQLGGLRQRLTSGFDRKFAENENLVNNLQTRVQAMEPINKLNELVVRHQSLSERLKAHMERVVENQLREISTLQARLTQRLPLDRIQRLQTEFSRLQTSLGNTMKDHIKAGEAGLSRLVAQLQLVSPLQTLARGYAVVTKPDGSTWGRIVSEIDSVTNGEEITAHVGDGAISAIVHSTTSRDMEGSSAGDASN